MVEKNRTLSICEIIFSIGKLIVVVCAFLAFALSMRQKEFDRFSQVKPLFELQESSSKSNFKVVNHGGLIYFAGCQADGAGKFLIETPRQYSTQSKAPRLFSFDRAIEKNSNITCYYRDTDLNAYALKLVAKPNGFYIDGVPLTYRSKVFVTMSVSWLDDIVNHLFPKNWFEPGKIPEDDMFKVVWEEKKNES